MVKLFDAWKLGELKEFLDEKVLFYENPKFIASDPIQIPHLFSLKEDIEIAAFLTAIISWGNRTMIIRERIQNDATLRLRSP